MYPSLLQEEELAAHRRNWLPIGGGGLLEVKESEPSWEPLEVSV